MLDDDHTNLLTNLVDKSQRRAAVVTDVAASLIAIDSGADAALRRPAASVDDRSDVHQANTCTCRELELPNMQGLKEIAAERHEWQTEKKRFI